jgi:hypothetical protein
MHGNTLEFIGILDSTSDLPRPGAAIQQSMPVEKSSARANVYRESSPAAPGGKSPKTRSSSDSRTYITGPRAVAIT